MDASTLRHAYTVPAILANAGENAATKFIDGPTSHRGTEIAGRPRFREQRYPPAERI
jgi:hypothetical protein